jgi:glycosyltransferase involved in cell wall biosynthesis
VSRLRIGYTCHDRFPSTDTNTQQIFWTLYEVARLGHTVDLRVRALPDADDVRAAVARHYGAPGDTLPDTLQLSAHRRGLSHQGLDTGWFDLTAPRRFDAAAHDVVWTRDPLALVSAMGGGVPVVFETFRPDFASTPAFAPWRWATLGRGRRHSVVPRLTGVITHSHLASAAFRQAGVPAERCLTAHNGYAPSLMEPVMPVDVARRKVGLPSDRPLLVYAGHVGPQKGTGALVELARAIPEVSVVIVGVDQASREGQWLSQQLETARVANVMTVPRVGLREVASYLYAADCLVIPPTDEPLRTYGRTVLPMKVFSYLAAGRPILAPRLPDIEEVLHDGETALLVEPGSPQASATAVRRLIGDRALAARLSQSAREAARGCTWSARAQAITAALERWLRRREV